MALWKKQPLQAVSVTGEIVELTDDLFEKMKNKIPNLTREEASELLVKSYQNDISSYVGVNLAEEDRIQRRARTALNRIFRCPQKYQKYYLYCKNPVLNQKYRFLDPEKNKQYGGNINLFRFAYSPKAKKETMVPLASAYSDSVPSVFSKIDYETNIYVMLNPSVEPRTHGKEKVFCYRNFVVDMDMHEFPVELALHMGLQAAELIAREVNKKMFRGCEPNIITATGRGVQIVWSVLPLRGDWSTSEKTWKTIANALCDMMADWLKRHPQFALFDIDRAASTRPGGLIRVPGTCNQEVKEELGLEYAITRAFMPIKRHERKYKDLLNALNPFIPAAESAQKKGAQTFEELDIPDDVKNLFSLNTGEHKRRHKNVLGLVRKHYKDSDSEHWHIPEGVRDKVLFILGNLALKFMPIETVMDKMYGLNEKCFSPALSEEEVKDYLSTSVRKENSDGTRGYNFSDKYILETLGLPDKKIPFYRSFDKMKEIRKAEKAARAEKKRALKEEAFNLHKLGLTFQQIAEKLNTCRQTVSTWVKTIAEELKNTTTKLADNLTAAFTEEPVKADESQNVQTEAQEVQLEAVQPEPQPENVAAMSDEQCASDSITKPKTTIPNIFDRVRAFKAEVSDCYLKREATKTLWQLMAPVDEAVGTVQLANRQKRLLGSLFQKARQLRPDDSSVWQLDPATIISA